MGFAFEIESPSDTDTPRRWHSEFVLDPSSKNPDDTSEQKDTETFGLEDVAESLCI